MRIVGFDPNGFMIVLICVGYVVGLAIVVSAYAPSKRAQRKRKTRG